MPDAPDRDFLEVRDLKKYFAVRGGLFRRVANQVKAVEKEW